MFKNGSEDTYANLTLVLRMQRYPFIFSNERKYRLRRHFVFWAGWWLFSSFLYSFSALAIEIPYFKRFPLAAIEALFFLIPHMFLSYSLIYWLVPNFILKGKYLLSFFGVMALLVGTGAIASLVGVYFLPIIRELVLGYLYVPPPHISEVNFFVGLLSGLRGAITIGGFAAAIKLMKYWYMKEQRNMELLRQNVESQLQLLKAQVHPHFLFNTLNNIYSFTQVNSPVASRLVMGLSDMLRYMLYECNQSLVPLSKELKMLQDYIMLEQVRYDDALEITIDLPDNAGEFEIAPLLLLPFVENCFKHGTSQVIEQPWISLRIGITNRRLEMKLVNGKAENNNRSMSRGIGINNVRKRLEMLYPGRHELKISNEPDVFIVDLQLELERSVTPKDVRTPQMIPS